ncbi:MAG: hypothetical protein M3Q27_01440, partial [Actinomycetota bacterium]|nr:hypothetical protein [Actinomycetota bacterium]
MPTRLLLEGFDIEELLTRIREEHGPGARIVQAEKVRIGGVGGFFAKEKFEIAVEVDDVTVGIRAQGNPARPAAAAAAARAVAVAVASAPAPVGAGSALSVALDQIDSTASYLNALVAAADEEESAPSVRSAARPAAPQVTSFVPPKVTVHEPLAARPADEELPRPDTHPLLAVRGGADREESAQVATARTRNGVSTESPIFADVLARIALDVAPVQPAPFRAIVAEPVAEAAEVVAEAPVVASAPVASIFEQTQSALASTPLWEEVARAAATTPDPTPVPEKPYVMADAFAAAQAAYLASVRATPAAQEPPAALDPVEVPAAPVAAPALAPVEPVAASVEPAVEAPVPALGPAPIVAAG